MHTQQSINEGLAKIIKYDTTFYNPAQKTNRDISILVLSYYFKSKDSIRILDAMSATGLRGIRYLKEIPNSKVVFNDISNESIRCIKENLVLNNVETPDTLTFCNFEEVFKLDKKSLVIQSDCNSLMCKFKNYFDVIDIDPFGSCSEYIENALRSIKHNGVLCFTSTDKGVLCTNEKKCNTKYDTVILKKYSLNELPLRVLLSCISRSAAKFGFNIEPILSLTLDFYVRVFVKVVKRQPKKKIENNNLFYLCKCGYSVELDRRIPEFKELNQECFNEILNFCKNEQINFCEKIINENICEICGIKMKVYGPFWTKNLHNKDLIQNIMSSTQVDNRMTGIFNFVLQEIDTMWYYEISLLSKILKICCIKLKDMCTALKNIGFNVSLTHCDINGFKTNAPLKIIIAILKIKNKGDRTFLFLENEFVENLFNTKFYKGKISSGFGPLCLPN